MTADDIRHRRRFELATFKAAQPHQASLRNSDSHCSRSCSSVPFTLNVAISKLFHQPSLRPPQLSSELRRRAAVSKVSFVSIHRTLLNTTVWLLLFAYLSPHLPGSTDASDEEPLLSPTQQGWAQPPNSNNMSRRLLLFSSAHQTAPLSSTSCAIPTHPQTRGSETSSKIGRPALFPFYEFMRRLFASLPFIHLPPQQHQRRNMLQQPPPHSLSYDAAQPSIIHCESPPFCYTELSADDFRLHYPLPFVCFWLFLSTLCWFVYSHLLPYENVVLLFLPRPVQEFVQYHLGRCRELAAKRRCRAISPADDKYAASDKAHLHKHATHSSQPPTPETVLKRFEPAEEDACVANSPGAWPPVADVFLDNFNSTCRSRGVGFTHAILICPLALYCVCVDPCLTADAMTAVSPTWTVTGMIMGGYFVWDLVVVILDWKDDSWQWLLHAVVCLFSLCSCFFCSDVPMCYFAACLLLFEVSTPFMTLRYFCSKAGYTDGLFYHVTGLCFLLAFMCSRIIWAGWWLFPKIYASLLYGGEVSARVSFARKLWYYIAIPTFYALNVYWAYLIGKSVVHGSSEGAGARRSKQTQPRLHGSDGEAVMERHKDLKSSSEDENFSTAKSGPRSSAVGQVVHKTRASRSGGSSQERGDVQTQSQAEEACCCVRPRTGSGENDVSKRTGDTTTTNSASEEDNGTNCRAAESDPLASSMPGSTGMRKTILTRLPRGSRVNADSRNCAEIRGLVQ